MSSFLKIADLSGFTIAALDTSEIDTIAAWFPRGGVIDVNIAERGMVYSLHGQNVCQEHIAKIDIWIGYKESEKNKAWLSAIERAKASDYKTVKDKEWFGQADDQYIDALNELTLARAAKKYFENKAGNFSSWHYAFKTFLNRDYSLERLGNGQSNGYNIGRDLGSDLHPSDHPPAEAEDQESAEVDDQTWGDTDDNTMWK